jgi:hypothetical protein
MVTTTIVAAKSIALWHLRARVEMRLSEIGTLKTALFMRYILEQQ